MMSHSYAFSLYLDHFDIILSTANCFRRRCIYRNIRWDIADEIHDYAKVDARIMQ